MLGRRHSVASKRTPHDHRCESLKYATKDDNFAIEASFLRGTNRIVNVNLVGFRTSFC